MRSSRPIWIPTVISITVIWIVYGALLARQYHLLHTGAPMSDTGPSFGLAFITTIVGPCLLVATVAIIIATAVVKKRRERLGKLKIQN